MDWGQVLYLVLVFGGVIALAYYGTRFLGARMGGRKVTRQLRVLEAMPIGSGGQGFYLLQVLQDVYVVAVTAHGVESIAKYSAADFDQPEEMAPSTPSFAATLWDELRRRKS
jgi:flagellar biogenesis protein FliO